jgi:hypothetical protein
MSCEFQRTGNGAYKSIKAHGLASAFEPGIIDNSRMESMGYTGAKGNT